MEKIQEHFLQDIYRLKEGIILEVNKYKSLKYFSEMSSKETAGSLKKKKIKGISSTYQLQEDFELYNGAVVKSGTYIKDSIMIEPTNAPSLYQAQLKSSGGSIAGDISFHRKLHVAIMAILSSYEQ